MAPEETENFGFTLSDPSTEETVTKDEFGNVTRVIKRTVVSTHTVEIDLDTGEPIVGSELVEEGVDGDHNLSTVEESSSTTTTTTTTQHSVEKVTKVVSVEESKEAVTEERKMIESTESKSTKDALESGITGISSKGLQ